jgi:hypothetical protein
MTDRWAGWAFQAISMLLTALPGSHRWAVLLAILALMSMTYGTVYLLARCPNPPRSIKTFLITCSWEASEPAGAELDSSKLQSEARATPPARASKG